MPSILVAEDSPTQSVVIRNLLSAAGFDVQAVTNGVEALKSLAESAPAAVLTDLDMPEMNGLDLVVAVRQQYPQIPVILMTAFGSEEIAVQALQSGAASYVPKKNLSQDLVNTLQDVLEVARATREDSQLAEFLTGLDLRFELPGVSPPVAAVVAAVQDAMGDLKLGDEIDRIRVGVALDTAIHNFLIYGNLELTPEQLQDAYNLSDGGDSYFKMLEERSRQAPYCDRRIHVAVHMTTTCVQCIVGQDGPGLDDQARTQPADPGELAGGRARGWLLVKAFMDEATFDEAGTEVVLTRRFGA
jgi:CheY-like chemotaxis protein